MATTTTKKTESKAKSTVGMADLFSFPTFDLAGVMAAQQKNVEAFIEANRVAFEGYKVVAEKQAALFSKAVEDASGAARDVMNTKTPEANAAEQIELAQDIARTGFENVREVAELALKTNREAFAVIEKRVGEGAREFKTAQAR